MAKTLSSSVLYIIIIKVMEIMRIISSTKIRVSLIIVGIATALICIVALLFEYNAFNSLRTLNLAPDNFNIRLISKITISLWPF